LTAHQPAKWQGGNAWTMGAINSNHPSETMGAFFMPLYGKYTIRRHIFMSRTIKQSAELEGRVYVHLANGKVGNDFLRQAEAEGFIFGDGVKPTERDYAAVMAINQDHTINYVGFVGMMAYGSGAKMIGNKQLIRIEFDKWKE
jgi:hypothetical protein